ncbi:glycoside hydrolase family 3 protein [Aquimarina celericrescens]|nr:glycoside hydrolase family 3 protein [Aquimarina celericrescens]
MIMLEDNLENLSKREKIGQFFFPAAFINDSQEEIQRLETLIKKFHIGGLTFFHSRASAATNFEGKKKITRNENSLQRLKELIEHYQSIAPTPLLMSIDAEWGLAMRVENTPQYPYALTLGALPDHQNELIFQTGKQIGNDLANIGIHINLAPVADINMNTDNPVIGYRSFGENKVKVSQKALSFHNGTKEAGVLSCFKHFPGHGDTNVDSHLGLPVINKSKAEIFDQELYPFIKAIESGIDSIMVGHLAIPSLSNGQHISATLSKDISKGLLREELGFTGVVISDALNMHSVSKLYQEKGLLEWKAFDAGNDILCFSEHVEEGIQMIGKKASDHQVEASFNRIWKMKQKAFSLQRSSIAPATSKVHSVLNQKIAQQTITMIKGSPQTLEKFKTVTFEAICIGKPICTFFDTIEGHINFKKYEYHEEDISEYNTKNILIALFPPSVKPIHNFGLERKMIDYIQNLSESNQVTLYLFGNPYVLRVLNIAQIENIILAYQDFKEFQEVAGQHFLGKQKANGNIPVTL